MTTQMFGTESDEYRKLREELHAAEIALRDQRERVALLRRKLLLDTVAQDYAFRVADTADPKGRVSELRLSELPSAPDRSLVLLHFMFGKAQTRPCPMCTLWADGYHGILPQLTRRLDFAVCVAGDPLEFRDYALSRGWSRLRIVSAADNSLKADLGFEAPDGAQAPGASVFRLAEDGRPRHFYSVCAMLGNGEFRGMDLLSPLWHILDLTPEGRGDFMPQLNY